MAQPSGDATAGGGLAKVLRVIGKTLAYILLGVVLLLVAVWVFIQLPIGRELIREQVNRQLASQFAGRITLDRMGSLGLFGVEDLDLRVTDPEGRKVLEVEDLDASIRPLGLVSSLLAEEGELLVYLSQVEVGHIEVLLEADPGGELYLAQALAPAPDQEETPPDPAARPFRLSVGNIRIAHVWAHGSPAPDLPHLDLELSQMESALDFTEARLRVLTPELEILSRNTWGRGKLEGRMAFALTVPSAEAEGKLTVEAAYLGRAGELPLALYADLEEESLKAEAAITRTSSEALRDLLPEAPVHAPLSLSAEVSGTLSELTIEAEVGVGESETELRGKVGLEEPLQVRIQADTADLDLRAFGPDLPATDLGFSAFLDARLGDVPFGVLRLDSQPSHVAGIPIASIELGGSFTETSLEATVAVRDLKLEADLMVTGRERGGGMAFEVGLVARADELHRFRALVPGLAGRATVTAEVDYVPAQSRLDGALCAEVAGFEASGFRAERARLTATVAGVAESPAVEGVLGLERASYGEYQAPNARVRLAGPLWAPRVYAAVDGTERLPDVEAWSQVSLQPELALAQPLLRLCRGEETLEITAERVVLASSDLRIRGAKIKGAGGLAVVELRHRPERLGLAASVRDFDLAVVAYVLGRPEMVARGVLDATVNLETSPEGTRGLVTVHLQKAHFPKIEDTEVRAQLELRGRSLSGFVHGHSGPGRLDLVAEQVTLGGPPLRLESWRTAAGVARLRADADLRRLEEVLPSQAFPLDEMSGELRVMGRVRRETPDAAPVLSLFVETQALSLMVQGKTQPRFDGKTVRAPPPLKLDSINLEVQLEVSGHEGSTELAGLLRDPRGPLVRLELEGEVPYRRLMSGEDLSPSLLAGLPLSVKLSVPRRRLEDFPEPLRPRGIEGEIELELTAIQRDGRPEFSIHGQAFELEFYDRPRSIPISAQLTGEFAGDNGWMAFELECAGEPSLEGHVRLRADPAPLYRGDLKATNWQTQVLLEAHGFPLEAVPQIADRHVSGALQGHFELRAGSERAPELLARLELEELEVSDIEFKPSFVDVRFSGGDLDTSIHLNQVDGGHAQLRGQVLVPESEGVSIDPAASSFLFDFRARRLRAGVIEPFVQGMVAELDGLIDAEVKAAFGPRAGGDAAEGYLNLRQGRFQLQTIGQDFRDVKARIVIGEGGDVRVEEFQASAAGGTVRGNASARLDGFGLTSARASVTIPDDAPLPVVVEGEPLAEAWGRVEVSLSTIAAGRATEIAIEIPEAGLRLPERSSHELQELAPAPEIRIGIQRDEDEFDLLRTGETDQFGAREQAEETGPGARIKIRLRGIQVRRGTGLRAELTGDLVVETGAETRVTGTITLQSGMLEVEGKRFEIERGIITFSGPPDNPEVVLTAVWTAPEGTRVYADFIGPLKTGKVTLRAEPARTQSEILSLILFGTTDGQAVPVESASADGESAGVAGGAIGVGGGLATQGLNRALDDLTDIDVTARIDTTDSANPRPEIEVQIARNISVAIAHVIGLSTAASNLDRNFLIVDWRFMRNWSLETTFGDRGTTVVDAVWQLRY